MKSQELARFLFQRAYAFLYLVTSIVRCQHGHSRSTRAVGCAFRL